jgi:cytoskeletal protein CcmA (bactofilin family)
MWALIGIPVLILIIAIIAAFLIFHRAPITTKTGPSSPTSIDPQALGPDAIKQLNDASAIAGSLQTLNIAPNTVFKNNLTVQGNTSLAKNLFVGGDLSVTGASNLQGPVTAGSGLTVTGPLNVTGTTSLSGNLNVAGSITTAGNLSVGSLTAGTITSTGTLTVEGHFAVSGATPTIQPDVATTGGTVAISGSDTAGTVTITTGPGAPAAGEMALITFHTAYPGTPRVFLTPVSLTSASLKYFVSQSPTFFSVETANLPTAGTVYSFNYFVVQ